MDAEDESVKFLEEHIEESFGGNNGRVCDRESFWLEQGDHARAVAEMYMLTKSGHERNLVCLFPPFLSA